MKNSFIVAMLLALACNSHAQAQWNQGTPSSSIYYDAGNVGIGTSAPKEKFQIGDRWTFHNGGHKLISYNWYFSGGEKRIVDDEASAIRFTSEGDIQFSTAPYGLMNSTVAWQTPLFLTNSGRVGMGTSTPQHALDVINYFQANSESQLFIGQNHDFGANSGRYGIGLGFQHIDGTGQGKKYHLSTWFANTRTNVLTFDYQGNMGIGVTSPSQKLDLVGRLKFRSDNSASAGVWFTGSDGGEIAFLGQLGNTSIDPLGIWHGGAWRFKVTSTGVVGINTRLEVGVEGYGANSLNSKLELRNNSGGDYNIAYIRQDKNNGGESDVVRIIDDRGYSANNTGSTLKVESWRGAGVSDGGILANFITINDGVPTSRFLINNTTGNVGIGTANPTQKLIVKGTVYSTEVKVDVNAGTVPDYVFEPTYNLPTLAETEAYIKANKHLPEVPSAKEMETNGINLSEMNMLLLKKVEELTLYLIESEKRNVEYEKRLKIIEASSINTNKK